MISAFPQVNFRKVTLTKTNTFTLGKVSNLKEETEKTEEMHGESLGFFYSEMQVLMLPFAYASLSTSLLS